MLLEIDAITRDFGGVRALDRVSLEVAAGTIHGLIGPNGAGKTTTLMALSGMVPIRSGRIVFMGRDITRMSAHRRVAEGIVQVPEGRQVLAGMTVRENLELGGYHRSQREVTADIYKMEERFPILDQRRNAMAGSLSGGEQQMLVIARGLMARPQLLFLDEPSLGLAPLIVREIFDIVEKLRKGGLTTLLVEQNAHLALASSTYAAVIETGSIVLQGPSNKLDSDPAVVATFLGQPV